MNINRPIRKVTIQLVSLFIKPIGITERLVLKNTKVDGYAMLDCRYIQINFTLRGEETV
ncbi:hypothetical protein [Paenibacillus glucanolyticus]|uniref:hypothetical protein n=1 Tax=Paenibacillus glucanolyticus TaxID=59843 RepID=UPI0034CF101A